MQAGPFEHLSPTLASGTHVRRPASDAARLVQDSNLRPVFRRVSVFETDALGRYANQPKPSTRYRVQLDWKQG